MRLKGLLDLLVQGLFRHQAFHHIREPHVMDQTLQKIVVVERMELLVLLNVMVGNMVGLTMQTNGF